MKQKNENRSPPTTRKESEPISEAEIDENLEDSFPASDPPSWTLGSEHRADTKQETENEEPAES
jgi:hypothetical protein